MDKLLRLYTYVDGVNDTLFPNSDNPIEIGEFRYDAKRMGGAPTIAASVYYPSCLDDVWTDNVYAKFNGEKYYLKQTPTSSYNNESTMYKHDLELVSERVILDNVYFFDTVTGDPQGDDKPVSNSTKVMFFGNIHEFVKRLNSSLEYAKLLKWEDGVDDNGNAIKIPNGYYVVVDTNANITTEEKLMSFEDQFFSNVLQEIYNTYEVPYYFDGKTIHIGYSNSNAVVPTFSYGVDDALLSITKNNANYKIVNRATATGSSDNIPFYYPNNSPKGDIAANPSGNFEVKILDTELYSNEIKLDGVIRKSNVEYENAKVNFGGIENYSGETLSAQMGTGGINKKCVIEFISKEVGIFLLSFSSSVTKYILKEEEKSDATFSIRYFVEVYDRTENKFTYDSNGNLSSIEDFEVPVPYANHKYEIFIKCYYAAEGKYAGKGGRIEYNATYSFGSKSGWMYEDKVVDLKDVGLEVVGDTVVGDTITQTLVKYIKTSQNLMPSIYRETDGEERFYNATNNTYEGVEFNNPYIEGKPKEHIFTVEDIKPTIEGTEVNGLRIDMFSEFAYDNDDNDETYEDEEGNVYFKHPYFYGKLRVMDFNLFDHAIEQQPMTISFTSGHCGACNFEIGVTEDYPQKNPVQVYEEDTTIDGILHKAGSLKRDENGMVLAGVEGTQQQVTTFQERQQDTSKYEVWIALRKEEETYGILMPQVAHRPKAAESGNEGDTFVIIGINLPQSYIINAEKKLEAEIIKYLQDNNDEKFTFSINFSRIYFEENDVLDQLNENSKIRIIYDNKPYDLYVSSFSYSMSEGDALPEIRVELDETLKVSQNALQNAISQVKSELGRAIGSIDVVGAATPYFLRKDADDEAQGRINFKKGIKFGEGGKVEIMPDNGAKLTIDYIEVTKKATFNSLEIAEKKHVGGQILLTPAAMKCGEVEEFDDYYRCYFQTKSEGGDEIFNQFAVNDQAICQTFNAWGSRYYWRLVVGVGEDYIDLSKTDCDEYSDIPSVGDSIILLGNRTDITRQSAIVLSAYDDDAPSLIMYNGINSYSLVEKNITGIIWNPETKEPQMYSYGSFFFGDRQLEKNFITFQQKDGDTDKNLYINGTLTIGAGSEGLSNLSEWADKESKINEAHSTASIAEKIARNAAESAKRVETLMSEIDDDAILTISEKRTLRTEWETINGVASLSTTGDSGSYMGTKELIDELGYKAGEEVIISYRDAVLTHNGIKIKFNNSGIVAFELAYNNLRECLTSVHLYMDETTYNFDRQLVAKALTAYYDAQSRILSQAQSGYSDGLAAKVSKLALNAQSSADAANTLALNAKNSAAEAAADAIKAQSTANKAVADANSAKAAADAAQTTADGSVTKLNEWSSDSVISPFEKQGISDERAFVVADKDDIDNQKAKYSIDNEETLYNAYLSAYKAYLADLNTVLSTSDACPVPADMSAHQGAYYQSRTALLSAISAAARNVADLAQDAADKAKDAASAAQTTADNAQSSANQAQDRADEAYKYSEKIAGLLSEIDDDSILSTSEKFAIRSEWEKINGAASFSYSGSKGSYPNAVEIANRLGVNMAERANLTMNGASIIYNSSSLSYVESGYRELELAYMSLKDYLISIKIYTNEPVANFDRRALAERLSAYYSAEENFLSKAQKFYTDERSEDTSKLLKADIVSLAESLAKDVGYSSWDDLVAAASAGKTITKGGFLNTVLLKASSILAEHIAAGAITSDKIKANAITAEKVDVDDLFAQHIEADDMNLKTGCVIGDLSIGKYVNACGKEDLVDSVHSKYTSVEQDGTYTHGARLSSGGIEVTGEAYGNGQCLLSNEFSVNASRSPILNEKPIVKIRANIRPALSVIGKSLFNTSVDGDNIVIEIDNGMISGLRPMSKKITANSYYLTEYDHTLFCTNSRTDLYLPEFPLVGQEYVILVPNGGVDVYGNGKKIYLFHDGIDRESYTCGDLGSRTEQRLYWNQADNKWWATYIRY